MVKTVVISKLYLQPPLQNQIQASFYYKQAIDSTWILIESNVTIDVDGTVLESPLPSFVIDSDILYNLRVDNEQCETIYMENILYPCGSGGGCPDGYTLSPDGSYCYIIVEADPIPPSGSFDTLVAKTNINYTTCGSYIYNDGYNVNGTGISNQISLANPFWVNGDGSCGTNNITDGVLNRCGVWASSVTTNQDIGFSVCVDIPTSKKYYVGMGVDNYGVVKIDGQVVIQQDAAAIDAQYGLTGGFATFKVWHIYPIVLTAGFHYIELFGHNISLAAAVGFEIYDNTPTEIEAATSYGDLNLIFSTKDEVGDDALLGTNGYSCPSGYSLAACESPIVCKK